MRSEQCLSTEDGSLRLLLVELGEQRLAIPALDVVEIVPLCTLSCPPASPSVLAGFLNIGATLIPVVRLSRFLHADDVPRQVHTPIVITRHEQESLGLIVSRALQLIQSPPGAVTTLTGHSIATQAVNLEGTIVPIVSTKHLLLEQEQRRIEELRQAEQLRLRELEEAPA